MTRIEEEHNEKKFCLRQKHMLKEMTQLYLFLWSCSFPHQVLTRDIMTWIIQTCTFRLTDPSTSKVKKFLSVKKRYICRSWHNVSHKKKWMFCSEMFWWKSSRKKRICKGRTWTTILIVTCVGGEETDSWDCKQKLRQYMLSCVWIFDVSDVITGEGDDEGRDYVRRERERLWVISKSSKERRRT